MSRIVEDIADTVVVTKKRDVIIKWIIITLPYIITAVFFIGGALVTIKSNLAKTQTAQKNNTIKLNTIKTDMNFNFDRVNNRIDVTNTRVDNTNVRVDGIMLHRLTDASNK